MNIICILLFHIHHLINDYYHQSNVCYSLQRVRRSGVSSELLKRFAPESALHLQPLVLWRAVHFLFIIYHLRSIIHCLSFAVIHYQHLSSIYCSGYGGGMCCLLAALWAFCAWRRPSRFHFSFCEGLTWDGCRESRRCSRDTNPESYITKHTSIRRQKLISIIIIIIIIIII